MARLSNGELLGYFTSYSEADTELLKISAVRPELCNYTLADVFDEVKSSKRFLSISKKQQSTLISAYKHFSTLHSAVFRKLRARDYQECIDRADDEDLSLSHQQKMRQVVSKLCAWGLDNDLISVDYSKLLYIPGVDVSVRNIFPREAIKTLYAHREERAAAIIFILINTGMRPIDLTKIKKDSRVNLTGHGLWLEGSKTAAGRDRYISVNDECWPIFLRFYMAAKPGEYIFPALGGGQLSVTAFRVREFYPCLDRLDIMDSPFNADGSRKKGREDERPKYLLYNCRHTFSSLSNRAGVDKAILQKSVGHVVGSPVTDDVYIYQDVDEYTKEFKKLGCLMKNIVGE